VKARLPAYHSAWRSFHASLCNVSGSKGGYRRSAAPLLKRARRDPSEFDARRDSDSAKAASGATSFQLYPRFLSWIAPSAAERPAKVPGSDSGSENRARKGRDPGESSFGRARGGLFLSRTFLLVESRRAFSANEFATCRYNVAHIFHRDAVAAVRLLQFPPRRRNPTYNLLVEDDEIRKGKSTPRRRMKRVQQPGNTSQLSKGGGGGRGGGRKSAARLSALDIDRMKLASARGDRSKYGRCSPRFRFIILAIIILDANNDTRKSLRTYVRTCDYSSEKKKREKKKEKGRNETGSNFSRSLSLSSPMPES